MMRAAMSLHPVAGATLFALGLATAPAQAGQEVPPPRALRPVEPALLPARGAGLWRATPPMIEGWSGDRHIPVIWFDDDADDAGDGFGDDDLSPWGDM
jgi:hypothetical protein